MEKLKNCPSCLKPFNTEELTPWLLIPCCCTICKECLDKSEQNGNICPLEMNVQVENSIINKKLLEQLKVNFGTRIVCNSHPEKKAKHYSSKLKKFICTICVIELKEVNIRTFNLEELSLFGSDVYTIGVQLESIGNRFKEFGKLLEEPSQVFNGDLLVTKLEEPYSWMSRNALEFQSTEKSLNQFSFKPFFLNEVNQRHFYKQLKASSILDKNQAKILSRIIPSQYSSLNFIYQGSKNKFSAKSFHQNCDNVGPTLTIISHYIKIPNPNNQISLLHSTTSQQYEKVTFGGYTTQNWGNDSNSTPLSVDQKAFLFQLNPIQIFPVFESQAHQSIFRSGDCLAAFGGNDTEASDIRILDGGAIAAIGSGKFYKLKVQDGQQSQILKLNNSYSNQVTELEVFSLK